mgnify:CR=1 FL=1
MPNPFSRWLCWALGGHMPIAKSVDGKLRMTCAYGCGWRSAGIETLGQQRGREEQERRVLTIRKWQQKRAQRREVA